MMAHHIAMFALLDQVSNRHRLLPGTDMDASLLSNHTTLQALGYPYKLGNVSHWYPGTLLGQLNRMQAGDQ